MEKIGPALREKILIVQDPRSFRTTTSEVLDRSGYATALVQDKLLPLYKVAQESPDLVLLDHGVAANEGLALLADLKADRFTQHIPVVVVGKPARASNWVPWLTRGADECLDYPYHPDVLAARVHALLRRTLPYDPVTHLPTGAYVQRQIDVWLAKNIPTAVLYVDIDHFSPYTALYDVKAGELVLQYLARLIVDVLPNGNVAIGHLGEDDFMMGFHSAGARTFAQTLVDRFADAQRLFYDLTDFANGCIPEITTGQPVAMRPLMTVSASLVTNERRVLTNFVQASSLLARLMVKAKLRGGNQVAVDG